MPPKVKEKKGMSLAQVEAALDKRFPGAVRRASDPALAIERISTGVLSLDIMLHGGWARGRHVELYGNANVGKNAVAYKGIQSAQELELGTAFLDVENTFDPEHAQNMGVDLEQLRYASQNDLGNGNRVFDYIEGLLRSQAFGVIVLDSIASLVPKVEIDNDLEAATMGMHQAKLMSLALRKLTVANSRTVIIFINQTRQAVGASAFAKQSITSGGRAMGFYAGTRLELVRTETIKGKASILNPQTGELTAGQRPKGHRILVRVEKEKTGAAFIGDETTLVYDYDLGTFDPVEDLIYLGRKFNIVHKSGSDWWMEGYDDDKKSGRPRFKGWLRKDYLVQEELEELIRDAAANQDAPEGEEDDESEG